MTIKKEWGSVSKMNVVETLKKNVETLKKNVVVNLKENQRINHVVTLKGNVT